MSDGTARGRVWRSSNAIQLCVLRNSDGSIDVEVRDTIGNSASITLSSTGAREVADEIRALTDQLEHD